VSPRPPSVPRVHDKLLVGKTERNPDIDPDSALLIVSLHERPYRAAQLRAFAPGAAPVRSLVPENPSSVEPRTLPTGLREPESREPESREPESREPESREPESREPGLQEPESSASWPASSQA
jgi:hypothetical protein